MRHNIFNDVHGSLRIALLNTCIFLSDKEGFDTTRSEEAIKKVGEVLRMFKAQVKYEGMYLLPLVFEYEPSIWDAYTREHHKAMNLARGIEEMLQLFSKSKDGGEQARLMHLIAEAFDEFMLFNYRHMDDEEEVLNEFLWRYYKDDAILQVQQEIEVVPTLVKPQQEKKEFRQANAA